MEAKKMNGDALIKKNNEKESEHKLYNYFKVHPSLLVSSISAIVLSISFLFNALIYTNECKYLKYWNLDSKLVDVNNSNQIYEFVTLSFFYLVILLLQRFIAVSIEKYQEQTKLIGYGKIILRRLGKELQKKKKQLSKGRKLETKEPKNGEVEKIVFEAEKIMTDSQLVLCDLNKKMRVTWRRIHKVGRRKLIATFALSTLLLTAAVYLFVVMNGVSMNVAQFFWFEFFIILLMWLLPNIGTFSLTGKLRKWSFRKGDIHKRVEDYLLLLRECEERGVQYPLEQLLDFDLKSFLSKSKLVSFAAYAFIMLICLVGAINATEQSKIEERNSFSIVEYDNKYYVIIYKDNTYFYLEEAMILGDEISICVDKQRRIIAEDVYSVNRTFETVQRVDREGKDFEQ